MANHYCATMRNLSTGGSKFALCLAIVFSSALNLAAQSRFDQSDARERSMVPLSDSFSSGSSWQGSSWLNNGLRQTPDWRLGVTVTNQENGVVVRNVTPNSAGARARLEPNDLIITVGGYQVGMIDGRLFDLGDELKRRADASGVVTMLVQDHNNGVISNVRVQLDASTSTLTGELIYRDRLPIPSDAVITVLVEDVTRPFAAIRGGQVSYRPNGANTIPFEIAYDPNYIFPEDTYQVRAFVTSAQGRMIYESAQAQRVLTQGNPSTARLNLVPVGTPIAGTGGGSVVTAGYPNFNQIDDEIIAIYRKYLNRSPTSGELAALRVSPNIQSRLSTLPIEMMAAQEYYDAAGNNNQVWLQKVFFTIVGKQPSPAEFNEWNQRLAQLGNSRTALLRQLYSVAPRR